MTDNDYRMIRKELPDMRFAAENSVFSVYADNLETGAKAVVKDHETGKLYNSTIVKTIDRNEDPEHYDTIYNNDDILTAYTDKFHYSTEFTTDDDRLYVFVRTENVI